MSEYNYSGDYDLQKLVLEDLNGDTYNLKEIFVEFNIYESIFNPALSGNLNVLDANNIITNLKISGGEKIHYEFCTGGKEDSPLEGTLVVYKIDKNEELNLHSRIFRLQLVSEEMVLNESTRVSRAYAGTCADILAQVYKELKIEKPLSMEQTKGVNNFVSPAMKPFEIFSWLSSRAVSTTDKRGFLFFETNEGFNFHSLESMYEQEDVAQYTRNLEAVKTNAEVGKLFTAVEELEIMPPVDMLTKLNIGSLGSVQKSLNPLNRVYTQTIFGDALQTSMERLEVNPVEASNTLSEHDNVLPVRMVKANASNLSVSVTVNGDSEVRAGNMCSLSIPSTENMDNGYKEDRLSGRFLIADVRHSLTKERYTMTNKLVKADYED